MKLKLYGLKDVYMKTESLEDFLSRGGNITKLATHENKQDMYSRYNERDAETFNSQTRVRVDNYKKKGKLPKDMIMYLKFRKRFGM